MPQTTGWWDPDWKPNGGVLEKTHRLQTELWRRRLIDARSRHESAVAELTRIIESNAPDSLPHPDAWKTVLQARFAESDALSVYIEALRVYSALSRGAGEEMKVSSAGGT
jgi:hypothetical protein